MVPLRFILIVILGICLFQGCSITDGSPSSTKRPGFVLTFDDDNIEEWYAIKDMLAEYGARATFYITKVDSLSNRQLHLLHELRASGHEIACHSKSHVYLNDFLKKGTLSEYLKAEVLPNLNNLEAEGFYPTSFAYPGGSRNKSADAELLKYFKIIRCTSESQRHAPVERISNLDDIFYAFDGSRIITGISIDNHVRIPIQEICKAFERAKNNGEAVVFYAHKPGDAQDNYMVNVDYLRLLLIEAKRMGLYSYTVSELVR